MSTLPAATVRRRSFGAPLAVAGLAVAGAATLRVRDPHVDGSYGFCPFHAITGWWCPGCGGMRAIGDLTHGDVGAALSSNIFVAPLLLVAVLAWLRWMRRRWHGEDLGPGGVSTRTVVVIVVVLTAFTIIRNTPWGSWLAPT